MTPLIFRGIISAIKKVENLYGIHGLTMNWCHKLVNFMEHSTIHAALHETKKVMIDAIHLNLMKELVPS